MGHSLAVHPRIPRDCDAPGNIPPANAAFRCLDHVDSLLESPALVLLAESDQHWSDLRDLLKTSQVTGGRVHDARIAALCRQHGVRELWSVDRDFGRFPGFDMVNPLVTTME